MKEKQKTLALKVLNEEMYSCNSGKQAWKLGKTYRVKGKLVICSNGYHLTYFPEEWNGTRVFLAEATGIGESQRDKFVCRTVRLIKELSKTELSAYQEAKATAEKAYQEAKATAGKAYQEATAPAGKAYQEAKATAGKAYQEAKATAEKAYQEAKAPAWKAYQEATAPAWKAYQEAKAPAWGCGF